MSERLLRFVVAHRRYIRVLSAVMLLIILVASVIALGVPTRVSRHIHGVRFLLPNGDIFFSRTQIHEMPASYFIENFADDPSAVLASGSGIVEFEVEELHTDTWTSSKRPARHETYSLFADWRITIEDGEVKHIETSLRRNNNAEQARQTLKATAATHE